MRQKADAVSDIIEHIGNLISKKEKDRVEQGRPLFAELPDLGSLRLHPLTFERDRAKDDPDGHPHHNIGGVMIAKINPGKDHQAKGIYKRQHPDSP